MKIKDLIDAIHHIDDDLIEQASKVKQRNKMIWVKVASIAACFALLIGAVTFLYKKPQFNNSSVQMSNASYQKLSAATVNYPEGYVFGDYETQNKIKNANPVQDKFYNAIKLFSYKTAAQIFLNKDENMFYSPMSLYYALSLVTAGTKGETQAELLNLLGVSDTQTLAEQCGNLYRLLYTDNQISQLRIANSLWLSNHFKYKDQYLKTAVKDYYASLFSVDFTSTDAGKAMSKWVAENTKGTLDYDNAPPNDQQIMSILNTIYFYDQWTDGFEASITEKDVFTLANGKTVLCDFMHAHNMQGYSVGKGYTRSSLGLKENGSMVFILPDEGVDVSELLSDPNKIQEIFNGGKGSYGDVYWQVPKFSYGTTLQLNKILKSLGVHAAFERGKADFTEITDSTAWISDVKQKTRISIDEKGVEASAYTEVTFDTLAAPDGRAYMFLNRPFIYGITSNDGTLLFMGVCNNPNG